MSAAAGAGTERGHARVPWGDALVSAVAAVSWALIGMAGTAALGLRLLGADAAGSSGPMTAAVVALGAGGSVTPSGDVSAFGLSGAEADTAVRITPLGVSLVGAVLLSWFFLRSLRAAGVEVSPAELLARAGTVVALFVAMLGGLAWAGHDVITIDGGSLGPDDVTGGGTGVPVPGLGDVGGLLPDRLGDLVDARASVGFTVDTAPTLLGGLAWAAGVLTVALLASRRTPLPRGWEALHRVVRPAVSALVTAVLVAVAAGLAAAAYAAAGDDRPGRIAGAALLGAPNGVWLSLPIGLFVPWDGHATGEPTRFLPHPLDDLLGAGSDRPVTLGRLAELDGRVWLLGVAAALLMLLAGVLTGVRTPVGVKSSGTDDSGAGGFGAGGSAGARRRPGALGFAGRCAVRLGGVTALGLPLLVWLTDVSVTASLSVLGVDAFGAGLTLHGHLGTAVLLGALWGAGAGAAGAGLAWTCGAAGRSSAAPARGDGPGGGAARHDAGAGRAGPGDAATEARHGTAAGRTNPGSAAESWPAVETWQASPGTRAGAPWADEGTWRARPRGGASGPGRRAGAGREATPGPGGPAAPFRGGPATRPEEAGPYAPGVPYRPPNPATNPYLRVPDELREPEDARPDEPHEPEDAHPDEPHEPEDAHPDEPHEPEDAHPDEPHEPEDARPGQPHEPEDARPGQPHEPEDARPGQPHEPEDARPGDGRTAADDEPKGHGAPAGPDEDGIYGAPTVIRPVGPPPRGPRRRSPGPRGGTGPPARPGDWPPPPPPPPPPPHRGPHGGG
ncbi:streptophobe family protein [Streptomyces sp. AHA2]|uniref:streptophobe family protein n=1 Tax=Streptomyces sp. AHA2 TaxID=3064526 RepID=UPI002FE27449